VQVALHQFPIYRVISLPSPRQKMTQNTNHTSLRKIELQSPLDLTYLESQARRSARARIDTALPPSAGTAKNAAGEDDVVRRRVEELVSGYIKRTFDGVRRNVCVNGLEFDESADGKEERDPDEGVYLHSPPFRFPVPNPYCSYTADANGRMY
jgi:hypothetical protein